MTFDKQYYDNRKKELLGEYQTLVNETEAEIERLVIKKLNKTQELQKKIQELEAQEKGSQEANKKTPQKEVAKPVKA
jgi:hypothetical protein